MIPGGMSPPMQGKQAVASGHNLILFSELTTPTSAGSAPATVGTYTDPETGIVCCQLTFPASAPGYGVANVTFSETAPATANTSYLWEVEVQSTSADWYRTIQPYMQSFDTVTAGTAYGPSAASSAGQVPANTWSRAGGAFTSSTQTYSGRLVFFKVGTTTTSPLVLRIRRASLKIIPNTPTPSNVPITDTTAMIANYRRTTGTAIFP